MFGDRLVERECLFFSGVNLLFFIFVSKYKNG